MSRLVYSKDALKTLGRMPVNMSKLIQSKLEQYADDPEAQSNNFILKGQGDIYRLRVGDWRILFIKTNDVIAIIKLRQEALFTRAK